MKVDAIDRVRLWLHESVKAHGSIALVDRQDIQGHALGKSMYGIVGAAMELVVVTVVLQDQTVDMDTVAAVFHTGE